MPLYLHKTVFEYLYPMLFQLEELRRLPSKYSGFLRSRIYECPSSDEKPFFYYRTELPYRRLDSRTDERVLILLQTLNLFINGFLYLIFFYSN